MQLDVSSLQVSDILQTGPCQFRQVVQRVVSTACNTHIRRVVVDILAVHLLMCLSIWWDCAADIAAFLIICQQACLQFSHRIICATSKLLPVGPKRGMLHS